MGFLGVARGVSKMKGLKCTIALLLCFLYVVDLKSHGIEARKTMEQIEDDLELERQLKILNVPNPAKTIITKWGDIHDCVDMYKQPSLSHPLLKDHKIQMKPSFVPEWEVNTALSPAGALPVTFELEECPDGTVPIRRTSKEDLLRAKAFSREFTTNFNQSKRHFSGQYIVDISEQHSGIFGATAFLSVYNPILTDPKQFTNAQIWINGGANDNPNYIMAGWTVNPTLYGDQRTRLFTFWTGDNYKNGCVNTFCQGFVQVDQSLSLDAVIYPVSTFGGKVLGIDLSVFQERDTGHWWLSVMHRKIGYWPKHLFNSLIDGCKGVSWGGLVNVGGNGVYPPMGSGVWPKQPYASYFSNLKYLNSTLGMTYPYLFPRRVDCKDCYDIDWEYLTRGLEFNFRFGGPGGKCCG